MDGQNLNPAVKKELRAVERTERRLEEAALRAKPAAWKNALEQKIPDKAQDGLESAFEKAFSIVFSQGRGVLEKSYNKTALQQTYSEQDAAAHSGSTRRVLRKMNQGAKQSRLVGMAVTAAEGVALGALGIGMPDIVIFTGALLRGVYEMALRYGFDYESPAEQLLILKLLEAPLSTGEEWQRRNAEVDRVLMLPERSIADDALNVQLQHTAKAFAMDMLVLKFVQGIPLLGIVGGAANPVYYHKVLRYVQLKYRKRYLLKQGAQ